MTTNNIDRIGGASTSLAIKAPVKVATTANITLFGTQTINGISVVANDRVLVKNQTNAVENGIYVASATSWARAKDFNGNRDVTKGTQVYVTDGGNAGTWRVSTSDPITIDSTEIQFVLQTSGSGGGGGGDLQAANNLSDVYSATTSFNNISPTTTLGDIIVNNGGNNIRLAMGGNGEYLQSTASGLVWATPIGGGDLLATNNLSDVDNAATARTNLGLDALAILATVDTAQIDDDAVTYAKIQNVSATDKILGRSSSGSGVVEEITCTAQGRALLDDATAGDQRTTLGLGTMATQAASSVSITGGSITGLSSPSGSSDAATKGYVDGVVSGITNVLEEVRVATTANATLSTGFENGDTVDGVTLATNDRILIKDQTTASENGIYVVQASGSPVRADDANTEAELANRIVVVTSGTVNADTAWFLQESTITVDTTDLHFVRYPSSAINSASDAIPHVFSASNSDGTVDVTSELEAAIEAADTAGVALFIPAGTYYLRNCDPNSGINIYAIPDTVCFINDWDAPAFRTLSQEAYHTGASTQFTVTSVTMETHSNVYTSDDAYVSVLNVSSNPISAGVKDGDIMHIHCTNDHPYNYRQLGINPLATTTGSAAIVVTHTGHGYSNGNEIRIWDTSDAITTINGIPAAQIFSKAGNVVTHTISGVTTNTYTITVSTNATATGSGGGDAIRATRTKSFYGESFRVYATEPSKIFVDGKLAWHEQYTDGIKANTYNTLRKCSVNGINFRGKTPDGEVTHIHVSNRGTGYTSAPTVSFSGGGGSGAAATAVVSDGSVVYVTITNHGSGYTSAPTVSFSGGGGSSAAATAVIEGSPFDADYDAPSGLHNHTLGLWYMPHADVRNCKFEELWEGAIEIRFSPFSTVTDCNFLKLPNYKTADSSRSGRLGYALQVYNSSHCSMTNCIATIARHAYTDGNAESSTYATSNWMEYGMSCFVNISNLATKNCSGSAIGTHEGANYLTVNGWTSIISNRGAQGGSYKGFHLQLRGQNIHVNSADFVGGSDGIRYHASEQINSKHILSNINIRDLTNAGNDSAGLRYVDARKTVNKSDVILTGDFSCSGVGRSIWVEEDGVVRSYGTISSRNILEWPIMMEGGIFECAKFIADYNENVSYATSGRRFASLVGEPTCIIRDLDIVLGAANNPQYIFLASDDSTKNVGLGNVTITNTFGVTKPDIVQSSKDHVYGWVDVTTSRFRKPQTTFTNSSNTLQLVDDGRTIIGNRSTSQTFTIPNAVPTGWNIDFIQQGAGVATFVMEAGGVLSSLTGSATSAGQYALHHLECISNVTGEDAVVVLSTISTGTVSGGGGVTSLPTTTKGDTVVHNGTSNVRLPVGTNNQVIIADASQPNGLKWDELPFSYLKDVTISIIPRTVGQAVVGSYTDKRLNLTADETLNVYHASLTGNGSHDTMRITRNANHTGGSGVASALYALTTAGAGSDTFEWAITGVVENYGDGENVGVYGQGNRKSAAAWATWGGVFECSDRTATPGNPSAPPASRVVIVNGVPRTIYGAMWGLEVDIFAQGSDTQNTRQGIGVVAGRARDQSTGARLSDVQNEVSMGIFVLASGSDPEEARFKYGITVGNPFDAGNLSCDAAYMANTTGLVGYRDAGSKVVGLQAEGTYEGSAIRVGEGSKISWDLANVCSSRYNGGVLEFSRPIKVTETGGATVGIDFGGLTFTSGYLLRSGCMDIQNNGQINFKQAGSGAFIDGTPSSFTDGGEWLVILRAGAARYIKVYE